MEGNIHTGRDEVHSLGCLDKNQTVNTLFLRNQLSCLFTLSRVGCSVPTKPSAVSGPSGVVPTAVPTEHSPLHLCVLQIPSCIIPVHFLGMGPLGREMGCGSPTSKKVSSEFLNVPVIEACCIPALQSFQGQAEEKVCRLSRVQIQRKKKITR